MRSLISLLLSNLIPIVIVVSVFIRIYAGIKNAAKKRQAPQAISNVQEEEDLDVWKRLEPDDEEETLPVQPEVFTRPLLMPAAPEGASPEVPVSTAPLAPLEPAPSYEMPQDNFRAAAFFRNVNRLPHLQQAVIFTEILGTPKGME
jgi:hypothetical protein